MVAAAATMGHARRVGLGASGSASTREFEFLSCSMAPDHEHVQSAGMHGYRDYIAEGVVEGVKRCRGVLEIEPRPDDLAFLLPYILGAAASGTTFALAETLPTLVLDVDKGPKICRYDLCKINTATFKSSAGRPLSLSLDIIGVAEDSTITFPSIAASLSTMQPYVHHQGVVTINSVVYNADELEMMIDNALLGDRFYQSQTLIGIPEGDRIVTVAFTSPFTSDENALFNLAVAGLGGTLAYTNGGCSFTSTFGKLQKPQKGPGIPAKVQEVTNRHAFQSRRTGSTPSIAVVNDSTP